MLVRKNHIQNVGEKNLSLDLNIIFILGYSDYSARTDQLAWLETAST